MLAVQAAAFGLTREAVAARRPMVVRQAADPAMRGVAALDAEDRVVGFAYGFPSRPGTWWRSVVDPPVRAAGKAGWLVDAFEVAELHVLPAWQGRGLGRALLLGLLDAPESARALLTAVDAPTPARRLYRRTGFVDLARPVRFPGHSEPYVVMGAVLPLVPRPAVPATAPATATATARLDGRLDGPVDGREPVRDDVPSRPRGAGESPFQDRL